MSFDYDVDEDEEQYTEAHNVSATSGDEFSSEFGDFEDIDFEALGINPNTPTMAKPGTEEKVLMLAARYAAGIPLWNHRDCYDHGPGQSVARIPQKG
ncbi:MAG: hypothetical protein FJ267_07145 [Planctomycetes bacterium]|nr:hypothetical protein [Planctomycetota bacterium]